MIYLITGTPGSGKTLYAVSTLIARLAAEKIKDKKGVEIKRRVLIDGIPDLLIPHEVLPTLEENDKGVYTSDGDGIDKWPYWCKPGDIIVVDEVQRYWRPRGMGTKPPEMIKALETHRHFGVDFIIITQNPMLIDQNVRRLVGRHQHVRRMLGMARAIIYDWDSCNVVVSNTKGSTSSLWAYPKNAYKLYKSSELHTKQRQKIPIWLFVPVLAVVGGFAVAPTAFGSLRGAMSGKGVGSASVAAPVPVAAGSAAVVALAPSVAASRPMVSASAPALPASAPSAAASEASEDKFAGCVASPKVCGCYTVKGVKVVKPLEFCAAHLAGLGLGRKSADISKVPDIMEPGNRAVAALADGSVLAFMARRVPPAVQHPLGFEAVLR